MARPLERCPNCSSELASPAGEAPWCARCEWNLDDLSVSGQPETRRLDVWSHRKAFELNKALFDEVSGRPPTRPKWTAARAFLVATSVLLTLGSVGGIVGGIALLFVHQFGLRVLGFFVILISLAIRPRLKRRRIESGFVSRPEAPEFFGLLDEVSDRLGAPRITTLVTDDQWDATCLVQGMRREPTLIIGLPLFGALSPQGRVALLGVALGRLVNGDPTNAPFAEGALTTFGRLAEIFDPHQLVRVAGGNDLNDVRIYGTRGHSARLMTFGWLGSLLGTILFTPLWCVSRWIQSGLTVVVAREHMRAAIYADAIAVQLAGSDGAAELFDAMLFADRMQTAVARSARRGEPVEQWHESAAAERKDAQTTQLIIEQRSIRYEATLFATHLPQGMRAQLVRTWPAAAGSEQVSPARWSAIDASMARQYQRTRHALTIG